MQKNTTKIWLGLILAIAFMLRFWGLGLGELVFDEGLYGFRSIGWLDYLESSYQTTPVQWLSDKTDLPGWLKLSFHDHPPLFFLIQKISFGLFDDSLLASRLPSVIFGVASTYLFYLILCQLFTKTKTPANQGLTLIGMFLVSVNFAHISVSRMAMMESVLFFFILLNIYYFLKLLENSKHWLGFGITLGLAFLTKYIAAFLLPVYFVFLIMRRRDVLKKKEIWLAALLALIIFSPVILYNILSYKTFGHFDLQLAYIFKQNTPWSGNGIWGKNQEPFSVIAENLPLIFSRPFIAAALAGFILALFKIKKQPQNWLMLLVLLFSILLLVFTGAAIRFTSLLVIPMAYFAALFFTYLWPRSPKIIPAILLLFVANELFFTINRVFINPPDYGVVKLDRYFDSILGDGRSEAIPTHPTYLNEVIQKYAAERPVTLEPTGLIYDDDIATGPMLWLFSRRQYYHAIPVMTSSKFQESLKNNPDMFRGLTLYFIKAEAAAPTNPIRQTDYAKQVEELLVSQNQKPAVVITTRYHQPAFRVYKFSLK